MKLRRLVAAFAVAASTTVLALTAASPASAVPAPPGCPAVEAISVRGSTQAQNDPNTLTYQQMQAVQDRSTQGVRIHDLVYPAVAFDSNEPGSNYSRSVRAGVNALQARIDQVSTNCPGAKIAIAGYSQGAQVVGNTLDQQPVSGGKKVEAVVLFGDPKFNGDEPYNFGSYRKTVDGSLGARPTGALATFADRLRSYCRVDDTVCQAGAQGDGHFQYADNRPNASNFILNRVGG